MPRRRNTIRLALTVALVLLSGCTVFESPDAADTVTAEETVVTETTQPSQTTTVSETPPQTETPTTVTPGLAVPRDERLILNATGPLNLSVTMYESEDATTAVANASYEFDEPAVVHVSEFTPDGWVVLRMDGEEIWSSHVNSAEQYRVAISPDGTAELESYSVR